MQSISSGTKIQDTLFWMNRFTAWPGYSPLHHLQALHTGESGVRDLYLWDQVPPQGPTHIQKKKWFTHQSTVMKFFSRPCLSHISLHLLWVLINKLQVFLPDHAPTKVDLITDSRKPFALCANFQLGWIEKLLRRTVYHAQLLLGHHIIGVTLFWY